MKKVMKKVVVTVLVMVVSSLLVTVQAASVKALLALGEEGIQQIAKHLSKDVAGEGAERQIRQMLSATMRTLNNGTMPASSTAVDNLLRQYFPKDMLSKELDSVDPQDFFTRFSPAIVDATNHSAVLKKQKQFYTLISCKQCVPNELGRLGITIIPQEHPVSKGLNRMLTRDPDLLEEPTISKVLRNEGRRFKLNMDHVMPRIADHSQKVVLLDSIFRMNSGTRVQKSIGNLVKKIPEGGRLSLFKDTQLWSLLVVGNPTDDELLKIKPLFQYLAQAKPKNESQLNRAIVEVFTQHGTESAAYKRVKNVCCSGYGICHILP